MNTEKHAIITAMPSTDAVAVEFQLEDLIRRVVREEPLCPLTASQGPPLQPVKAEQSPS